MVDASDSRAARRHRRDSRTGARAAELAAQAADHSGGRPDSGECRRRDSSRFGPGASTCRPVWRSARASRMRTSLTALFDAIGDGDAGGAVTLQTQAIDRPGVRQARSRRTRLLRRVRRPFRPRNADGADRRTDDRVFRGEARPGVRRTADANCSGTTWAARRRFTRRLVPPGASGVPPASSSARTSRIRAHTRSTTRWARRCSPSAWASAA